MLHKVRQRNHTVSEHDMTNSLITNKGDKTIISKKVILGSGPFYLNQLAKIGHDVQLKWVTYTHILTQKLHRN